MRFTAPRHEFIGLTTCAGVVGEPLLSSSLGMNSSEQNIAFHLLRYLAIAMNSSEQIITFHLLFYYTNQTHRKETTEAWQHCVL